MSNSTTPHNALQCAPVQEIEPTSSPAAPDLIERLNAVSVASDFEEYLEAVRDLATAPDADRRAVAAWCQTELDGIEAQAELDRPDAKADLARLGYGA